MIYNEAINRLREGIGFKNDSSNTTVTLFSVDEDAETVNCEVKIQGLTPNGYLFGDPKRTEIYLELKKLTNFLSVIEFRNYVEYTIKERLKK